MKIIYCDRCQKKVDRFVPVINHELCDECFEGYRKERHRVDMKFSWWLDTYLAQQPTEEPTPNHDDVESPLTPSADASVYIQELTPHHDDVESPLSPSVNVSVDTDFGVEPSADILEIS